MEHLQNKVSSCYRLHYSSKEQFRFLSFFFLEVNQTKMQLIKKLHSSLSMSEGLQLICISDTGDSFH